MIVKLTRGMYAQIDDIDMDLSGTRWKTHSGNNRSHTYYAFNNTFGMMHRIILARKLGRNLVDGEQCHHIDGNGLNNARNNLMVVSASQNSAKSRLRKSKSGLRGVYPAPPVRKNPWTVHIRIPNTKDIAFGSYSDKYIAACVYDAIAKEIWGEFAVTNFPY